MFPAPAGMNRGLINRFFPADDVPRTRGDEPPPTELVALVKKCSPHPRG